MSKKIAIFASGSGSNTEKIIQYFKSNKNIQIVAVFSNKADAFVLKRAKNHNIPTHFFPYNEWINPINIIQRLKKLEVDYIILAGFLLKIHPSLVYLYPNHIINIHPALLPKFGGKGMYGINVHKAVIEANEKESGITIHYVNEHYDKGATIFQAKCEVLPSDTPNSLAEKIHKLEHQHFPEVIEQIITTQ